jgi:hypothetical protein
MCTNIYKLPNDIIYMICKYVNPRGIINMALCLYHIKGHDNYEAPYVEYAYNYILPNLLDDISQWSEAVHIRRINNTNNKSIDIIFSIIEICKAIRDDLKIISIYNPLTPNKNVLYMIYSYLTEDYDEHVSRTQTYPIDDIILTLDDCDETYAILGVLDIHGEFNDNMTKIYYNKIKNDSCRYAKLMQLYYSYGDAINRQIACDYADKIIISDLKFSDDKFVWMNTPIDNSVNTRDACMTVLLDLYVGEKYTTLYEHLYDKAYFDKINDDSIYTYHIHRNTFSYDYKYIKTLYLRKSYDIISNHASCVFTHIRKYARYGMINITGNYNDIIEMILMIYSSTEFLNIGDVKHRINTIMDIIILIIEKSTNYAIASKHQNYIRSPSGFTYNNMLIEISYNIITSPNIRLCDDCIIYMKLLIEYVPRLYEIIHSEYIKDICSNKNVHTDLIDLYYKAIASQSGP